ncbi:MAG: beta-propeller fold lactonase family protein, partial [Acidobacteria bacterium]|nr:beta-propeller fold lactonase family protein [Acidobacteriota bacterium]
MKSLPRLFAAIVLSVFALGVLGGCSGVNSGGGGKTLSSIAVTPAAPANLKVGATQQFTATGTFSDSTTADITSTVTWTSGTPATATISAAGLATGVAAGTTAITAKMGTVTSPAVTLTVIAVTSIAVTPNPASVAVGSTIPFTATATYTDASTGNVTTQATWASLPTSSATIVATTGVATGVANGTAQITATIGTVVSPGVTLTVGTGGTPVPIAVKIQQLNPTIPVGGVEDFTAKFLMSDSTLQPPSATVTWTSGTPATATIATTGAASGLASGTSSITAASTGLTSDNTTLTVVAAVPRFVFAAGNNDVAAATYVINSANATLTPSGLLRNTSKPAQIVPSPNGRFAYGPGANSIGTIDVYAIDPKTGALTLSSTQNSGVASIAPFQSIMDPTGSFLYIVDSNGNLIGLATDTKNFDGSLSSLLNSPYPVGTFPVGVAEDPAAKFVYVTNSTSGDISGFKTKADGSLTSLGAATLSGSGAGSGPGFPAIDPAGAFLYVPNSNDATISVFSINSTTGAIAKVGPDVSTGAGTAPFMLVVSPSNKFLYVTDETNNTVIKFAIGAGGALSGLTTTPTGNFPQGLAIDSAGASLVVANSTDNTLTYYSVDGTTGALTEGQTVQTRAVPFFVNIASGIAAPVIAPAAVEAANTGNGVGTGSVSSYTVNSGTGAVTAAATSPKTTLDGNNQAYASASGKFFYTATSTGKKLQGFSLNASADLTALPGTAANLSPNVPGGVYAELADNYVFAAGTTPASIISFNNDPTLGLTSNSTLSAGLTSVNAIAGDVQGVLIYALGLNVLQPVLITTSGAPVLPGAATALPQAGNWTAGAIDPSARFLVAADSVTQKISSFAIQPVAGTTNSTCTTLPGPPPVPPADGCLTPVPSSTIAVGAGLNGPYALTFDPLGRFLFVADEATGKVAVFSFSSTGIAAAIGTPVTVDPSGVTNIAVDA